MVKDTIRLITLIYFSSMPWAFAETLPPTMEQLPQFLINLGHDFGFDITKEVTTPVINTLLDATTLGGLQKTNVELFLGSIMGKTIVDPGSRSPLVSLNNLTNAIFKNGSYSSPSNNASTPDGSLSVNTLLDQQPYQNNPVSQSILNTLTTPDFTFCSLITQRCNSSSGTAGDLASKCCSTPALFQSQIGINVLGTIPSPLALANPLEPSVINQLNGNTLLDPMLYSTTASSSENQQGTPPSSASTGLRAISQAQEAENFIRYATAAVAPSPQTSYRVYSELYQQAMNTTSPATPVEQQAAAQATLSTYLATMRSFAAQTSVGVGNLYYILSRRMAQSPEGATNPTSDALNEYRMATRRLFDAASSGPGGQSTQWIQQINTASPPTVEKEMAILLAEINYQLYLTRQQQERLLLTNSIMLFQLGHLIQPQPLQPPSQ